MNKQTQFLETNSIFVDSGVVLAFVELFRYIKNIRIQIDSEKFAKGRLQILNQLFNMKSYFYHIRKEVHHYFF